MSRILKVGDDKTFKNKHEMYDYLGVTKYNVNSADWPVDDKREVWCGFIKNDVNEWENRFLDNETILVMYNKNKTDEEPEGKIFDETIVFIREKRNAPIQFKGVFKQIEKDENSITYKRIKKSIPIPL